MSGLNSRKYEEDSGNNPLHLAVKAGRYDMVEFILNATDMKLEREDKNFDGDTALMLAVLYSDLKMVRILVEKGGTDVNTKESEGFSLFMAACANGKREIVEYLLSQTSCNVYSKNQAGQNALHRAAFYGEVSIIRLLLRKTKLSLTARDSRGNTPLHFAAMRLNMICFRYIIKKLSELSETELKKKNQDGLTPVSLLIKSFNLIRKDDRLIMEQEVLSYVHDRSKPPSSFYELLKEQGKGQLVNKGIKESNATRLNQIIVGQTNVFVKPETNNLDTNHNQIIEINKCTNVEQELEFYNKNTIIQSNLLQNSQIISPLNMMAIQDTLNEESPKKKESLKNHIFSNEEKSKLASRKNNFSNIIIPTIQNKIVTKKDN